MFLFTFTWMFELSLVKISQKSGLSEEGPQFWPAQSPDLTLCDFFCGGGHRKVTRRPKILLNLEVNIQELFQRIKNRFMRKAVEDLTKSLRECIENTEIYTFKFPPVGS